MQPVFKLELDQEEFGSWGRCFEQVLVFYLFFDDSEYL